MKKIALTIWDGWISPVFDVCQEALVLEIDQEKVLSSKKIDLHSVGPLQKIERLVDLEVETLVCGAITDPVYEQAEPRGLEVIGFVAGEIDKVVHAFICGCLPAPALSMPGCYGRRKGFNGGRGRRRGRGRNRGHSNGRE